MTISPDNGFPTRLASYLAAITPGTNEETRRILFLGLLRDAFGVDLGQFQVEERVYGGRVDALLGTLVFEFKRDLEADLEDAKAQLQRYISDLRLSHPTANYTAVATDGIRLRLFSPTYTEGGVQVTELAPVGELDLEREQTDPQALYLRLDAIIAHFRAERLPATAQTVVAGLGPASPAFRTAFASFQRLYNGLGAHPSLQIRVQQWRRYLAIVYGDDVGDESVFLNHTYLATVARLIALLRLGTSFAPTLEEVGRVLRGSYFEEQAGLANFVEDDFFTWFLLEPAGADGLGLAWRLLRTLMTYDFSHVSEDVLKELYQGLLDREARHGLGEYYTPDWLAELVLREELRLPDDPRRSLLDPACGSGTFLFIAIRLMREALELEGVAPADILAHVLANVVGMDVHPLAVTIARTNYLLALGDLLLAPRDKVTVPVYLADAIKLPETTGALGKTGPYAIPAEPNIFLQVPQAMEPAGLDYLLPFMKDKYGRAALQAQTPQAWDRAWLTFHQFLITPTTSRKPFHLSPEDAEVMVQTQQVLVDLMRQGKDTVWFFILSNALRPTFLKQRQFDLVVGNPPWLSLRYLRNPDYYQWVRRQVLEEYRLLDKGKPHLFTQMELATLFFARAADLYLREGGTIAFVMPRSVLVAQQHAKFTQMVFKGPSPPAPSPLPRERGREEGLGDTPRTPAEGPSPSALPQAQAREEPGGTLRLGLRRVLDLEGVSPLFNVPACVLVAEKGRWPAFPVEGRVFTGDLLVKNRSLAEAKALLTERSVPLRRVEGRLAPEGPSPLTLSREFTLSEAEGKGVSGERSRSFYYDKFYQGATIVPRNLWFVHLVAGPLGFSRETPYFQTDEEQARTAKAPWRDVRMAGNVEARFLYATLPSGHLVPFGYTRLSPVILPLLEEGGRYTLLNADAALDRGFHHLAEWLRQAQGHWERLARRGPAGQPREPSVVRWLNYRNKLTGQSPQRRYRVLYVAVGTNLCAAIVDTQSGLTLPLDGELLPLSGFLCEHKTYVYETEGQEEAHFLQAMLNAPVLDLLIKPSQTVGLWGKRDIEKRAVQYPIPQFDPGNAVHARLAELGRACAQRVAQVLPELAARYRSIGRLRGKVRRLLAQELAEIDALARRVLGVA